MGRKSFILGTVGRLPSEGREYSLVSLIGRNRPLARIQPQVGSYGADSEGRGLARWLLSWILGGLPVMCFYDYNVFGRLGEIKLCGQNVLRRTLTSMSWGARLLS